MLGYPAASPPNVMHGRLVNRGGRIMSRYALAWLSNMRAVLGLLKHPVYALRLKNERARSSHISWSESSPLTAERGIHTACGSMVSRTETDQLSRLSDERR